MKKTNRQLESGDFTHSEFSADFFDFDVQRSRSAAHRNRFSAPSKKKIKNLKNKKNGENES